MILFIIASIVIIAATTTRENGVMAFSSISPSHIAALPRRLSSAPPPHAASSPSSASSSPQQLDAILFDCDGVLADTERDGHRISFNMAFASFGIDEVWDEVRYGRLLAVGGGKERMTAHWVSLIVEIKLHHLLLLLTLIALRSSSYKCRMRWDGRHKSQSTNAQKQLNNYMSKRRRHSCNLLMMAVYHYVRVYSV